MGDTKGKKLNAGSDIPLEISMAYAICASIESIDTFSERRARHLARNPFIREERVNRRIAGIEEEIQSLTKAIDVLHDKINEDGIRIGAIELLKEATEKGSITVDLDSATKTYQSRYVPKFKKELEEKEKALSKKQQKLATLTILKSIFDEETPERILEKRNELVELLNNLTLSDTPQTLSTRKNHLIAMTSVLYKEELGLKDFSDYDFDKISFPLIENAWAFGLALSVIALVASPAGSVLSGLGALGILKTPISALGSRLALKSNLSDGNAANIYMATNAPDVLIALPLALSYDVLHNFVKEPIRKRLDRQILSSYMPSLKLPSHEGAVRYLNEFAIKYPEFAEAISQIVPNNLAIEDANPVTHTIKVGGVNHRLIEGEIHPENDSTTTVGNPAEAKNQANGKS